ncbi:MAG TPA: hypothetical protein VFS77_22195 [Pyrinomonadaceae bacterium]|nr:hypothetical protein [Pyrinomonadaceae bacterium]
MTDDENVERSLGRRTLDSAYFLRWIPFMSLIAVMIMQTIYFTRYVSGLEASKTQLINTVAEIRAEVKALSASVNQGAIPSAQNQWRIEQVERQTSEQRQMLSDITRRISAVESNGRSSRER